MDNRGLAASFASSEANTSSSYDAVKKAIEAVHLIGPRTYKITKLKPGPIRFIVFGCQGSGDDAQKKTAELMGEFKDIPLMFGAGDNAYKKVMDTPYHEDFEKYYTGIYPKDKKGTMALGNHDWVRQIAIAVWISMYYRWLPEGESAGINQAAHTYYHILEEVFLKRFTLFNQEEIPCDDLLHWNMPYYFFSYILENETTKAQIIILNTCTLLDDYLDYVEGKVDEYGFQDRVGADNTITKKRNQISWLNEVYKDAKLNGRKIFILEHNPVNNQSNRAFQSKHDTNQYMYPDDGDYIYSYKEDGTPDESRKPTKETQKETSRIIRLVHRLKNKKVTYDVDGVPHEKIIRLESDAMDKLIDAVFQDLRIEPDCFLTAHQHFLSWYNNTKDKLKDHRVVQFNSGGGCADLHNRATYRDHPYVGYQSKESGFGIVTCDGGSFTIDVHTIGGNHIHLSELSHEPVTQDHWDQKVNQLRKVILSTVDNYFYSLKESETELRKRLDKPVVMQSPNGLFATAVDNISYGFTTLKEKVKNPYHNANEKEFQVVQDIQTFFNQHKLPSFEKCKLKLAELTAKLLHECPASPFHAVLQAAIKQHYHMPLNQFLVVKFKEDDANTRKPGIIMK